MNQNKIKQNRVTVGGKLAANPTFGITPNGNKYAKVNLASSFQNSWGKTVIEYNSCTLWKEHVSSVKTLKKGDFLELSGRLVDRKITNADGSRRSNIELLPFELNVNSASLEDTNFVEFYGNLTRDPEISITKNGVKFAKIAVAVANSKSIKGEGPADFFNITLWRGQADLVSNLKKGQSVEVTGSIKNSSYTDKEGNTVYYTEIIPNFIGEKVWEKKKEDVTTEKSVDDSVDMLEAMVIEEESDMPF